MAREYSEYFTAKKRDLDEFTEKRSRFIGYISPVTDEKQAVDFINEIKSKHWDAKHNVYAYVLRDGQIRRYSDDGEPQGTAGIPVLDVLLKENLTDCAVVVTRYFGGILLGVIEIFGKAYISSQVADAICFAVLIVVLLVKPTGILGKNIQEKV